LVAGPGHDVTLLLRQWGGGDPEALNELVPLVYQELRRVAAAQLRGERANHTLQPTELVHEAYARLIGQRRVQWQNRAHFFAIAARMMRRVLVDHARRRQAVKRGKDVERISLVSAALPGEREADLIALDDALTGLAQLDPDQSQIVELRFFGGLTVEEVAEVTGTSPATVKREWATAKAWLLHEIRKGPGAAAPPR
jgi:RNA polymerase sigma factor (TIGR02999 family)